MFLYFSNNLGVRFQVFFFQGRQPPVALELSSYFAVLFQSAVIRPIQISLLYQNLHTNLTEFGHRFGLLVWVIHQGLSASDGNIRREVFSGDNFYIFTEDMFALSPRRFVYKGIKRPVIGRFNKSLQRKKYYVARLTFDTVQRHKKFAGRFKICLGIHLSVSD